MRTRILPLILLTIILLLSSCHSNPLLNIGIHPWIGYETFYLARDFNWLSPEIHLHEGKSADDSLQALSSGIIDAACLTLDEVLRARAVGVPLTILFIFDISSGADMVLARPEIKTLDNLAGKRVGVENNTLGALMLEKLLEAANLNQTAITVINLEVGDQQINAWRENKIDAVITYEPTATLIRALDGQNIFDSRQIPETIFDVFAIRTTKIKEYRSVVHDLVATHFRTVSYIHTNREDVNYRIMARENVSHDDIRKIMAGISIPSLASNQHYLRQGKILHTARLISQLLTKTILIKHEDSLRDLINPSFLFPEEDN